MTDGFMSAEIDRYIRLREVDDGKPLADPIFMRRYRTEAPDFPVHVIAFHVDDHGRESAACYIHFTLMGDLMLGGGACVDDRVVRRMSPDARRALKKAGGLYRHALAWSVRHLRSRCKALFGYCGDALAERVDLAVGFERTRHPRLLVYFMQDMEPVERDRLIAQANAVGPF